ncbi:MAG: TIGR04013 family B12-binding domain/radical SAM domain-containing protein [Deltaproteobacteria bacterium]|nr:TIGR04013 family B12-binding domain/radical SAM domain-containing protein [Deltaproteobacteria bacterium]
MRPTTLLLRDRPAARGALNALAAAGGAAEVAWAAEPAALGRAAAAARDRGRQVVVGWSFFSAGFAEARRSLAAARASGADGALHLAGGPHATAEPAAVLAAGFDLCALGEGERTLALLLERLARGGPAAGPGLAWLEGAALQRGGRPQPVDLDGVPPFPPSGERGGPIEITRGCVHACRFCQASFAAGPRLRHRSPEVVAHWAGLQVRLGRRDVRFVTPSALAYGSADGAPRLDRVEALLEAVRAAVGSEGRLFLGTFPSEIRPEHVTPEALRLLRRLVDNRSLLLGAQSGSDRMLHASHRGHGAGEVEQAVRLAAEAGFEPQVDFILGMPGETDEDAAASRRLMEALAARGARIRGHVFMPLPGTPWAGAPAGAPDAASLLLLERLASAGRAMGQWKAQRRHAEELAAGRSSPR